MRTENELEVLLKDMDILLKSLHFDPDSILEPVLSFMRQLFWQPWREIGMWKEGDATGSCRLPPSSWFNRAQCKISHVNSA